MDVLEHTLDQLGRAARDDRGRLVAAAAGRLLRPGLRRGADQGERRRDAAELAGTALALLALADGVPGDVEAAVADLLAGTGSVDGERGGSSWRLVGGDGSGGPGVWVGPGRLAYTAGTRSYDTGPEPDRDADRGAATDADHGSDPEPDRYPAGPVGDRLAFADLEFTDDD